jgi:predicted nucleic acid-binding protein
MIILDTNVISELMRERPDPRVMAWLRAQPPQQLMTTAITVGELRFGAKALAEGKRRDALDAAITEMLQGPLKRSVLAFDLSAAEVYGALSAELRRKGTPIGMSDSMIAAIALFHDATLATRNTKDFIPCGVRVVNPFSAEQAQAQ